MTQKRISKYPCPNRVKRRRVQGVAPLSNKGGQQFLSLLIISLHVDFSSDEIHKLALKSNFELLSPTSNLTKKQSVTNACQIAADSITFDMFLLEVSITRQNASSGAVKKNVNKLPLLLDEDEDDVEVATLSSTGCMLGDSSSIACSPRSSPLMDCERRNKILPLMK